MNKIFEVTFGSHLYGTDTPNSDLDLKAIYLPSAREICLGTYKKTITTTRPKQHGERNKKDDVDIEVFSLDRYLQLLTESQTVALDMLFAPPQSVLIDNAIFREIYNNRFRLLNNNINAFVGYAKTQASKYGVKGFRVHALRSVLELLKAWEGKAYRLGDLDLENWVPYFGNEHIKIVQLKGPNGTTEPYLQVCDKKIAFHATLKYATEHMQKRFDEYGQRALLAENNEGIDWKALSHAVRVNNEAVELLETGFITFPRLDKELLLNIKLGKLPYKEVAEIIENGLEDLKISLSKSVLKDKPDEEWINNFIFNIYSDIVKGG